MATLSGTKKNDYIDTSDINFGSRSRAQESAPNASDVIATKLKLDTVPSASSSNEDIAWNETIHQAIALSGSGPPVATPAMAVEVLAVLNGASAIEGRAGHLSLTAPESASAVAASAQAAHDMLVHLFPAQSAMFHAQLGLGAAPQWADLGPLISPDQLLPEPPKALDQAQSLGEVDSTLPTPGQTEIAKFWVSGGHKPGAGNDSEFIATKHEPDPVPSTSSPNEAIVWNELMLQAIALSGSGPPVATRAMAIESLAVFNAVSAIEGTPGYLVSLTAPEGASAVAAAAQAAHDVLIKLFPAQSAIFDAQLALSLGSVADGQSESDGIAVGAQAAAAMIELRAHDGWNASVAYTPGTDPGMWQPTPPAYLPAAAPQWADLDPFALISPDQFQPDGPPDLTSRAYAKALEQVQSLGGVDSTLRTPEQTEIAKFWVFGARTPPGAWNDIASDTAQAEGLGLTETAQLLATLNVAEADSLIAVWDAKYLYNTWRPVTAIQNADDIGNRWVSEDPDWLPLLVTPNHPEYVSAHSAISAAAAEVLTEFFGKHYEFSFTAPTGVTREFDSFWDAANEAGMSRIYGGIHFSFSNQDGKALGEDVADWVLESFAQSSWADAEALTDIAFVADAPWG